MLKDCRNGVHLARRTRTMVFQKKGLWGTCRRGGGHPGIDARERLTMALKKFHCPNSVPKPRTGEAKKRRSRH